MRNKRFLSVFLLLSVIFFTLNSVAQMSTIIPDQKLFFDVFYFIYKDKAATGTFCSYKGKTFFVTAAHTFDEVNASGNRVRSLKNGSNLKAALDINGKPPYTSIEGKVYFDPDMNVDAAVIQMDLINDSGMRTSLESDQAISVGQDVIFLGFPLNIVTVFEGKRLALTKHAILSQFIDAGEGFLYLFDGHNNPGFSGGPVIKKNLDGSLSMVAIINAYFHDPLKGQATYKNEKVDFDINTNSGIIIATPVTRITKIIDDNKLTS